jgi:diguanylate cyclase (GGDEF)-like protein
MAAAIGSIVLLLVILLFERVSGRSLLADAFLPVETILRVGALIALVVSRQARVRHDRQIAVRLTELALTDPLTGLANRRALANAMERELPLRRSSGCECALIVWDLNDFKAINDARGHLVGDRLLREFANAIRRSARSTDLPARAGGDEFVLFMPDAGEEGAHQVDERLQQLLREMWRETGCSTAVGIATYPLDGHTLDELFAAADRRMFRDKSQYQRSA